MFSFSSLPHDAPNALAYLYSKHVIQSQDACASAAGAGNVESQTITVPNRSSGSVSIVQNYPYDQVNRLLRAAEKQSARHVDPDGHDPDDGDNGVVSGTVSFLKGVAQGAANVVVGTANIVKDSVVGCASCVANTVIDQAKSIGSTLKADFDIATHPKQAAEAISSAVKEGGTDKALNILGNATGEVLASVAIAKGLKALGGAVKGEGLTTPGKYLAI